MLAPGERRALFRRIFLAHYGHISAYVGRRLAPEDVEDVVEETFLVAWRRLEDIPGEDVALPWLYGIARRVVAQSLRSGRRRGRLLARLGGLRQGDAAVSPEIERVDDRELILRALARLRPDDQELLRLAEWEDLPVADLARIFGCSTNAVTIRLHRAHKRFAEALAAVEGPVLAVEEASR